MFIPDPDLDFLPIPDLGGQKDTESRIPDPDPQHRFHMRFNRCARAVKAEWKSADDLIRFWSTDYDDDAAFKQLLMRRLKPVENDPDYITVKIRSVNHEIRLRVKKKGTRMATLMSRYANLVGRPLHPQRFKYGGRGLNANDTPESLEMQDGSVVTIVHS
jgi:hypothetical protein